MIRQGVRHDLESCVAERREKRLRVAHGSDRVHALTGETRELPSCTVEQVHRRARRESRLHHARSARPQARATGRNAPGQHDCVHALEPARRLPHRARRQQAPVTEFPRGVHDDDLVVARQAQVLQAVVADHDLRAFPLREARGRDAIGADHDHVRTAAGMQQRLVTDIKRVVARRDHADAAGVSPAVTAQHDTDAPAPRRELAREPRRYRRLARAADGEVPDHDHRHADPPALQHAGRIQAASCSHAEPEDPRQRPERNAAPRGPVPDRLQSRAGAHSLNCMR